MATFQVAAPELFNFSKPETWHKWMQRFDCFRSASGLEDKSGVTQVNSLIYSMGTEADDIFASFELNDENKKKYAKLNKRKQEDSENVENFVTSLYTLSEHCGYNDLCEEMIRDRIVIGIIDANLSVKMQLDPDLTLKKATDMARQSESVRKQQSLVRSDLCDSTVDAVKMKTRNQRERQSMPRPKKPFNQQKGAGCRRCGHRQNHSRDNCPAKGVKCFKCSNMGHFRKMCDQQVH
jgi:hypothetical protein